MIRFALRELRNQKKMTLLFVLSLGIGLSAFVAVDTFRLSIDRALGLRSKGILGADISFGARRPLTSDEITAAEKALPETVAQTEVIETFSMLATKENSRLAEIKAVGPGYPFFGEIQLEKQGVIQNTSNTDLQTADVIWLYPEVLLQLGLQVGDQIQIGKIKFTVSDSILADSAGIGAGASFAPPVYMSIQSLQKAELIQKGSTAYFARIYKFAGDQDADKVAEDLDAVLTDPAIRVTTHKNASEQVGRLVSYLNDYLGLSSLVALFLTAFGCAYLYRSYLAERTRDIAIYKSLGLKDQQVEAVYLWHSLILAILAFVPLFLVVWLILPYLSELTTKLLEIQLEVALDPRTVAVAFLALFAGSMLITYPQIRFTRQIESQYLLSGRYNLDQTSQWLLYIPFGVFYLVLAISLSQSVKTGLYFVGGLAGSILGFFILAQIAMAACRTLQNRGNIVIRWITRSVTRKASQFYAAFVALAMASLLTQFLPQLESSILSEIAPDGTESKIPSLFLFDIQPEQADSLVAWFKEKNLTPQTVAPMIRARLETINGEAFTKGERESLTREEERENRSRNRGYNLTFRSELSDSETILKGKFWSKPFQESDELPEISIETRFAERLNVDLGDVLQFEIQGVSVKGRITSERRVRWTSFQPNFFIQFQPGVLEDAPATYLVTTPYLPRLEAAKLQSELVQVFPNVSIIDVSRLVDRISELIRQMALALKGMAWLSLAVGLLVFYAVVSRQTHEKRQNVNLLKALGASRTLIMTVTMGEFILTAGLATLSGSLISLILTYSTTSQLFDGVFAPNPLQLLGTALTFFIVGSLVSFFAIMKVLSGHPQELLKETL